MKMQYRLTFALCLMVLFTAGIAFGAIDPANNTTYTNKTNTNETNATEIANETGNATAPVETTVKPADTTIVSPDATDKPVDTVAAPVDTTDEPVEETTDEPSSQASTPAEQSPGFGIVVTIMVVLSTIYISKKGR